MYGGIELPKIVSKMLARVFKTVLFIEFTKKF